MIRIKKEGMYNISKLHYDGIRNWISDTLQFYLNVFEIIGHKIQIKEYKRNLTMFTQESTLKTNIEILLKIKLKSEDSIESVLNNISTDIFQESYINNADQYVEVLKEIQKVNKIIIMARPRRLKNLYIYLINKYPGFVDNVVPVENTFDKVFICELNKIFEQVFNYSKFTNKKGFRYGKRLYWEAYDLTEQLGIRVCPYCNRLYINCIVTKNEKSYKIKKITRPTLDHFTAQSEYPIFGLSFYNLIPSCGVCNSSIKNVKKFSVETHIQPYINEFGDDATFNFSFVPHAELKINKDLIAIEIKVNEKSLLFDKINKSISDLELREIYKDHAKDIVELIENRMSKCNDVQIDALIKLTNGKLTRDEILDMYLGKEISKDRIINTCLGKLKNDIIKQLKRIKTDQMPKIS